MVETIDDNVSNLIVALRIRPLCEDEIFQGATPIAHKVDDNMVVLMDPLEDTEDILRQNRSREKQFIYDIVLDASATQEETYNKTCKFLIPSVINGYNTTCFAYGATGAGKTHTMLGKDDSPGIMALALTDLFEQMNSIENDDMIYKVTMSYLEIYNEMIRDLLYTSSGYLDLREDSKGVQIAGLTEHSAANTQEVMSILKEGNKQRTQEPTAANKTSSRSHAVLIISVKQRNKVAGLKQQVRVGKLFLIDLAGSERASNTQNRGKRMIEGAHINRSLLALGNCINALSDKTGTKYVNYRDSKLTRLLKDALGGNCRTVMIANVSPASFHFEESRNTLMYADRAKNIRTKVRQNVLDMTLHISQFSNIITDLREEIKRLKLRLEQNTFTKNMSTLHAIQNEVMSKEDVEVMRIRNEMEDVYNNQLHLGLKLVELTKQNSEIELENTKLQLKINNFGFSTIGEDNDYEGQNMDKDEIFTALENLKERKKSNDKLMNEITKQLQYSNNRIAKSKESLERIHTNPQQQEFFNLLKKINKVQDENIQLLKNLTKQSIELKKRDIVIMSMLEYSDLADQLIEGQQKLMDLHDLSLTDNLKRLQKHYKNIGPFKKASFLPSIELTKPKNLCAILTSDEDQNYLSITRSHSSNNNLSSRDNISDRSGKTYTINCGYQNNEISESHDKYNLTQMGSLTSFKTIKNDDFSKRRFLQSPLDSNRAIDDDIRTLSTPSVVANNIEIEDMILEGEDRRNNNKIMSKQIYTKRKNNINYPRTNRSRYEVDNYSVDGSILNKKTRGRKMEPRMARQNDVDEKSIILTRLKQQHRNLSQEGKSKETLSFSINGHALK